LAKGENPCRVIFIIAASRNHNGAVAKHNPDPRTTCSSRAHLHPSSENAQAAANHHHVGAVAIAAATSLHETFSQPKCERNPSLERESALYHVSVSHSTVKWSNLVKHSKAGQTINSGQRLVKGEGFNYKY